MIKSSIHALVHGVGDDSQYFHIYSTKQFDYNLLKHLVPDVADQIMKSQRYDVEVSIADNIWLDPNVPKDELFIGYVANVWAKNSKFKGGAYFVSHDYIRLLGMLEEAYGDLSQYEDDYVADIQVRQSIYVIGGG